MLFSNEEVIRLVSGFEPGDDGLAAKSKDLVLCLLEHGTIPFSPRQYWPGHITCTALVFHPDDARTLAIYHHRLHRWLLPGGHVEEDDPSLDAAAAREAEEETRVEIDQTFAPFLAGIDVHGIPPKAQTPYHLHHDLIWCFRASSDRFELTAEAPQAAWIAPGQWDELDLSESIRRSIRRASRSL
ncbi:MAG TPA: NUDIX domain-containing protein [Bryobacteraceae bacterium]|nr:NUDIX domain-containing protein [Bryobacteraceae bacterium]